MVTNSTSFKYFYIWFAIGLGLIGLVVYLSLTATPLETLDFSSADKLNHLLAYGVLMGWFGQISPQMKRQWWWAIGFSLLGVVLEMLQGMGGHRTFDYVDMLANAVGVGLGWWLTKGWFAGLLLRIDTALADKLKPH